MPREHKSKYFWPASAITEADMALLYRARQLSRPKVPINELIARAIRAQYGTGAVAPVRSEPAAQAQTQAA